MKPAYSITSPPDGASDTVALFEQSYVQESRPLAEALSHVPGDKETQVLARLAEECGLPFLRRPEFPADGYPADEISIDFLKKHAILIGTTNPGRVVVTNDPFDLAALQTVLRLIEEHDTGDESSGPIQLALGLREEIAMTLEHFYPSQDDDGGEEAAHTEATLEDDDLERLKDLAREAGIVRKVDYLVNTALDSRASDIHFESLESSLLVRCRIDGLLHNLDSIPKAQQPAVLSRIKLMAGLDIAERRLPQDGAITWKSLGRRVDIRVATTPTLFGESIVLRLLEKERGSYDMAALGMSPEQRALLESMLGKSHGMIFVTGPTGSGKTTTLYAALLALRNETRKIITVEDPVEYQIEGINQVQVNPRIGLTFASALRSFLRHDPDVLLVGEVRDQETAKISIESSLTGHLVLSTLHTKDAPTAVTRLRDLGVEPFLIADSLLVVMAQRLVRMLCPKCKTTVPITPAEKAVLTSNILDSEPPQKLYAPNPDGCEACGLTGWSGREGIFEMIPVTEAVRNAVTMGRDAGSIAEIAEGEGFEPMRVHGLRKAVQGVTTIAEVMRVTSLE